MINSTYKEEADPYQKLANLIMMIAEVERKVEVTRQVLVENVEFDPAQAYWRLDRKGVNVVSKKDLAVFLAENDVKVRSRDLFLLFERLDRDRDGVICWAEFLMTVISKRGYSSKKAAGTMKISSHFPLEIEHSMVRIFEEELSGLKEIRHLQKRLYENNDFDAKAAFSDIDGQNKGYFNSQDLYDFLTRNLGTTTFCRVERAMRRMDLDCDGRINFDDFMRAVRASTTRNFKAKRAGGGSATPSVSPHKSKRVANNRGSFKAQLVESSPHCPEMPAVSASNPTGGGGMASKGAKQSAKASSDIHIAVANGGRRGPDGELTHHHHRPKNRQSTAKKSPNSHHNYSNSRIRSSNHRQMSTKYEPMNSNSGSAYPESTHNHKNSKTAGHRAQRHYDYKRTQDFRRPRQTEEEKRRVRLNSLKKSRMCTEKQIKARYLNIMSQKRGSQRDSQRDSESDLRDSNPGPKPYRENSSKRSQGGPGAGDSEMGRGRRHRRVSDSKKFETPVKENVYPDGVSRNSKNSGSVNDFKCQSTKRNRKGQQSSPRHSRRRLKERKRSVNRHSGKSIEERQSRGSKDGRPVRGNYHHDSNAPEDVYDNHGRDSEPRVGYSPKEAKNQDSRQNSGYGQKEYAKMNHREVEAAEQGHRHPQNSAKSRKRKGCLSSSPDAHSQWYKKSSASNIYCDVTEKQEQSHEVKYLLEKRRSTQLSQKSQMDQNYRRGSILDRRRSSQVSDNKILSRKSSNKSSRSQSRVKKNSSKNRSFRKRRSIQDPQQGRDPHQEHVYQPKQLRGSQNKQKKRRKSRRKSKHKSPLRPEIMQNLVIPVEDAKNQPKPRNHSVEDNPKNSCNLLDTEDIKRHIPKGRQVESIYEPIPVHEESTKVHQKLRNGRIEPPSNYEDFNKNLSGDMLETKEEIQTPYNSMGFGQQSNTTLSPISRKNSQYVVVQGKSEHSQPKPVDEGVDERLAKPEKAREQHVYEQRSFDGSGGSKSRSVSQGRFSRSRSPSVSRSIGRGSGGLHSRALSRRKTSDTYLRDKKKIITGSPIKKDPRHHRQNLGSMRQLSRSGSSSVRRKSSLGRQLGSGAEIAQNLPQTSRRGNQAPSTQRDRRRTQKSSRSREGYKSPHFPGQMGEDGHPRRRSNRGDLEGYREQQMPSLRPDDNLNDDTPVKNTLKVVKENSVEKSIYSQEKLLIKRRCSHQLPEAGAGVESSHPKTQRSLSRKTSQREGQVSPSIERAKKMAQRLANASPRGHSKRSSRNKVLSGRGSQRVAPGIPEAEIGVKDPARQHAATQRAPESHQTYQNNLQPVLTSRRTSKAGNTTERRRIQKRDSKVQTERSHHHPTQPVQSSRQATRQEQSSRQATRQEQSRHTSSKMCSPMKKFAEKQAKGGLQQSSDASKDCPSLQGSSSVRSQTGFTIMPEMSSQGPNKQTEDDTNYLPKADKEQLIYALKCLLYHFRLDEEKRVTLTSRKDFVLPEIFSIIAQSKKAKALTKEQFFDLLEEANANHSYEDTMLVFEQYDQNGDGTLDYTEFVELICPLNPRKREAFLSKQGEEVSSYSDYTLHTRKAFRELITQLIKSGKAIRFQGNMVSKTIRFLIRAMEFRLKRQVNLDDIGDYLVDCGFDATYREVTGLLNWFGFEEPFEFDAGVLNTGASFSQQEEAGQAHGGGSKREGRKQQASRGKNKKKLRAF